MELFQETSKIWKIALITSMFGGLFLYYYLYNPTHSGLFIPCPFHYLTGYYCPGCGSQRAIHSLLHARFSDAFGFNPLMLLSLPIVIYGLGINIYNWIMRTGHRFMLFYNKTFIFGYFGLAIIFWIVRNLPYYPFNLLAPSG